MFLRTHHQNLSRRNQFYRCHFASKSSENTEQIRFVFGRERLREYVGEDFATGFFEEGGIVFEGYGDATKVTDHAHRECGDDVPVVHDTCDEAAGKTR
jgi:hypothetical protein